MTKLAFSRARAGAVLAFVLTIGSAHAQSDHTWVSAGGGGSTCTRTTPCANFTAAYTATNAGGVISVLNSGDYGTATIGKSITIRAESLDAGQIFVGTGGTAWIGVNIAATDTVAIEGLHFGGGGGIILTSGGSLYIRDCVIRNNNGNSAPFPGYGIRIQPNGGARVVISDTVVANNGFNNGGAGIWVVPQSTGTAQITLSRVIAEGNQFGIAVDGSASTGGINVTVTDSVMASNAQDGIVATTSAGGAPVGIMVKNSKSTNNGFGIRSIGASVTVRVSNSTVIGNGTGLTSLSGGALLSFGNNKVEANGANGTFSGPIALK